MDPLYQIIINLKKEEIRNFKIFTNRFQRADEVKVAILFDKLKGKKFDISDPELVASLFPDDPENLNAFYRLKNRLKSELEKSLLNLHHNLDERISTINLITLSSVFSYKSQYELSVHYLKKAEKSATENEFYDLLELIYNELINLSNYFNDLNPLEYIEKRKGLEEKNKLYVEANQAISAINYKLKNINFSKNPQDIGLRLEDILNELQIANEVYRIPKVKFSIYMCIRDILLQNRDFEGLEDYLIKTLKEFESENMFTKSTHNSRIALISWIINTLTINRKWDKSLQYTEILLEDLNKYGRLYYENYIWTYYQSLITNYMGSNRIKDAIKLLGQIKELPAPRGVTFYDYAIHGNLALCYYFEGNTSQAIKTLSVLLTKEAFPKLSSELQFSISILETIFHYDNNDMDFVGYKITEIKRQFRVLLKREDYAEELNFLKIIHAMINKAGGLHSPAVVALIEKFIKHAPPFQIGSEKHIDYALWLKSKLTRTSYYKSVLQALGH